MNPTGTAVAHKGSPRGAAEAGAHEWERSGRASAQGTRLQRGRCRSMEDDAPVIYGLEFQVGPGTAPGASEVTAGRPRGAKGRGHPGPAEGPLDARGARRSGPRPLAVGAPAACLPPPSFLVA